MFTGNFMPWSLASFGNRLFVGVQSLGGARIVYTPNGSSEDGNWFYSMGGDSGIPEAFDGIMDESTGTPKKSFNIGVNLFPFSNHLYAGTTSSYAPLMGATEEYLTGAHLWRSGDGTAWTKVTAGGFGDRHVVTFEGFAIFSGTLYVSGGKGANSSDKGLGGATIFRLVSG
jgi:hypothetical protein